MPTQHTVMEEPSYQLQVSKQAIQTIHSLNSEDQTRVENVLEDVASTRKPTDHSKVVVLNNNHRETLYKIRIGTYRAIGQLDSPVFRVLRFSSRDGAYQNVDELYENL